MRSGILVTHYLHRMECGMNNEYRYRLLARLRFRTPDGPEQPVLHPEQKTRWTMGYNLVHTFFVAWTLYYTHHPKVRMDYALGRPLRCRKLG